MKFYAVIDTNVIVSSMLKHNSNPGLIIDLVNNKTIIPLLNSEIIEEYIDVVMRNKFGFDKNDVDDAINNIKQNGIFLEREQTIDEFVDLDDIVFYEIVMSARNTMEAYLITGNVKHYPVKKYIVTPHEMIDIINKSNN